MAGLIVLCVFGAAVLLILYFWQPRDQTARRRRLGLGPPVSAARYGEERSSRASMVTVLAGPGQQLARYLPHRLVEHVDDLLIMASSQTPLAGFLGMWAATIGMGLLFAAYIAQANDRLTPPQVTLFTIVVVWVFAMVPYGLLRRRAHQRRRAITRALPDALDLLVTGVEAGLGVDAAFALVTEKTQGPLSDVFAGYLRQVGLGGSRRDALVDVARRSGVTDLVRIAASVAQAEQMGAVLGDVLRVQATDLRVIRRQRAQERAQRAPVLMTIPMVICFLPAMAAVVIVPSGLNLMDVVSRMGRGGGLGP